MVQNMLFAGVTHFSIICVTPYFFEFIPFLEYEQCYYITVLSFLLMHYLQDHILFTDVDIFKKEISQNPA